MAPFRGFITHGTYDGTIFHVLKFFVDKFTLTIWNRAGSMDGEGLVVVLQTDLHGFSDYWAGHWAEFRRVVENFGINGSEFGLDGLE